MTYTIESTTTKLGRERKRIKGFKYAQDMHHFLNKSDNANNWKESALGLKSGLYAYAGGKWHNVKTLDASILAHI